MEDFTWLAHLDDGETYAEYGPDGTARGWKSVPHERVTALELIPTRDDLHGFRIPVPEGAAPVLFRRRTVHIHLVSDARLSRGDTITVIGYESASSSHYWAAYPDGRVMGSAWAEAIQ